jgi:hypothetical protein
MSRGQYARRYNPREIFQCHDAFPTRPSCRRKPVSTDQLSFSNRGSRSMRGFRSKRLTRI